METLFSILLTIHIIAGSISLILFWVPLFTKKGGKIHRQVGNWYVYMMWIVVVTAFILSLINLYNERYIIAAFLGFLSILTASPLWYGIVILKYKKSVPPAILRIRKALGFVLFFGGLGLLAWAIMLKLEGMAILLLIFGILGVVTSSPIVFKKQTPDNQKLAILEHIDGILGTGIAAYTAFLAFGASSFFSSIFSGTMLAIPWVLPSIIGTFGTRYWMKKYQPTKA